MLAVPETLNQRIGDFAALVGLVLVLVTLFTSQRSSHILQMRTGMPRKRDWSIEILLNAFLAVFTFGLFLTGLPLFVESAGNLQLLGRQGPLREAFVLVWLLLTVLIVWQASLSIAGCEGRRKWEEDHGERDPKQRSS